jgi:hypothetical protein
VRVYMIGRDYQATDIDVAEAARRFMSWLTGAANPVLAEIIQRWLQQPADAGGLGALAESTEDVAVLRAELVTRWQRAYAAPGDGDGRPR